MTRMVERIVSIARSNAKGKKYAAIVRDNASGRTSTVNFGGLGYQQFKDSTPLKLFSSHDHGETKRRDRYFLRHSGTKNKAEAIEKEKKRGRKGRPGTYSPKLLSHMFLW